MTRRAVRGDVGAGACIERRRGVRGARETGGHRRERGGIEDAARSQRSELVLPLGSPQIQLLCSEAKNAILGAMARPALPEAGVVPRPRLFAAVVLNALVNGLGEELG